MNKIISQSAIDHRMHWINEIVTLENHFSLDTNRIEEELSNEVKKNGISSLLNHLRLCSAIPESYGHDISEEKLYSKYTDILISAAYSYCGLNSVVLTERANSADVEAIADSYSFVADAKAFRLSRTAKNQKDFKVQSMHGWKRGKPYAMVVCPLYQVPSKKSQIYHQAGIYNVCIFSYSHLAVLIKLAELEGKKMAIDLLYKIFRAVEALNPSEDASIYWQIVNSVMLKFRIYGLKRKLLRMKQLKFQK